jgi:hypothetical protein
MLRAGRCGKIGNEVEKNLNLEKDRTLTQCNRFHFLGQSRSS